MARRGSALGASVLAGLQGGSGRASLRCMPSTPAAAGDLKAGLKRPPPARGVASSFQGEGAAVDGAGVGPKADGGFGPGGSKPQGGKLARQGSQMQMSSIADLANLRASLKPSGSKKLW